MGTVIPGQFAFYEVIWGSFDQLKVHLKELQCLCLLACSIQLVRAFKWGAVWHFTLRGIRFIRSQISNFQRRLLLLSKIKGLILLTLIILIPLEIKDHGVTYLKAPSGSIEHARRHWHDSTFRCILVEKLLFNQLINANRSKMTLSKCRIRC